MNNLNQGASEAERDKFYALREEYDAYIADRCAQAMGIPFATWAARRTPAATTGDGELPPLPGAVIDAVAKPFAGMGGVEDYRAFARAAIEADRAQRQVAPASAQPADQELKSNSFVGQNAANLANKADAQPDQRESAAVEMIGWAACGCHACNEGRVTKEGWPITATRMILCPTCGNKRCPHASDHTLACTGSNEPGQDGSVYGAADPSPAAQPVAKDEQNEWQVLRMEDIPDPERKLDVVLTNGVTEFNRDYRQIDWTQVADWRYSQGQDSANNGAEGAG